MILLRKLRLFIILIIAIFNLSANNLNSLLDMNNYHSYSVDYWYPNYKTNTNNKLLLIDNKTARDNFHNLKCHFYDLPNCNDSQSPWNKNFVQTVINNIKQSNFTNYIPQTNYFKFNKYPFTTNDFQQLLINSNYKNIQQLKFDYNNKAIISSVNCYAYILPTDEPIFKSESILGQGYPFNLNIISNIPIAMPIYILTHSKDNLWALVLTPYFIAWVKSDDIAIVDNKFIQQYQKIANKNLTTIVDYNNIINLGHNLTKRLINGTILPTENLDKTHYKIYLPFKNQYGTAQLVTAVVDKNYAYKMPYPLTREYMLDIISKLIARPYGWGGYLNYNDCSLELQVILQTFGYFVPRNSGQQLMLGNVIDLSKMNEVDRLRYLDKSIMPFVSLVYVQGHIMLYIGAEYYDGHKIGLIYNNIWGLSNFARTHKYIIGGSSIIPLIKDYNEDLNIKSLISYPLFKVIKINTKKAIDIDMIPSMGIIHLD
jgi:hypothetical protein